MLAEGLSEFDRQVLDAMAELADHYPSGVSLEEITERLAGEDQDQLIYVDDSLMSSVSKLKRVGLLANLPGRLRITAEGVELAARV